MNRGTECNREKRHVYVASKRRSRAETEDRRLGRVPYLEESECLGEEQVHGESDLRGDDDGYRGPGSSANDVDGRVGAGRATLTVRM